MHFHLSSSDSEFTCSCDKSYLLLVELSSHKVGVDNELHRNNYTVIAAMNLPFSLIAERDK